MAIIKNADDAITYLQGSSRDADTESRLVDAVGKGKEMVGQMERVA